MGEVYRECMRFFVNILGVMKHNAIQFPQTDIELPVETIQCCVGL